MKANPGGAISPENVIGRDRLIERLWATLKHQSLVLVAERRMGKPALSKDGGAATGRNNDSGSRCRWRQQPIEFVERVAEDVEKHLNGFQKTATKTKEFLAS